MGTLLESPVNGGERRFWPALPVRQAEFPIVDITPAAIPFIRPREDHCPCAPCFESRADLPFQHFGLLSSSIAEAIQSQLAHYKWPVYGDVLQSSQVGLQLLLPLEIHIETAEIQKRKLQIFRTRIIYISDETCWIL